MHRIVLFAPLLAACGVAPAPTTAPAPVQASLHTYDVPDGTAPELVALVNRLFRPGEGQTATARAVEGPRGELVVTAPDEVHAGIAALLADLPARQEPGPKALRVEYWFATATPADAHAHPPTLGALTDTFTAVEAVDGPQAWTLLAHQSLVSLPGELGEVETRDFAAEQVLGWQPDRGVIVADLHTRVDRHGGTKTRVELRPGQTLVLSEATGETGTLYTFVRASPAE